MPAVAEPDPPPFVSAEGDAAGGDVDDADAQTLDAIGGGALRVVADGVDPKPMPEKLSVTPDTDVDGLRRYCGGEELNAELAGAGAGAGAGAVAYAGVDHMSSDGATDEAVVVIGAPSVVGAAGEAVENRARISCLLRVCADERDGAGGALKSRSKRLFAACRAAAVGFGFGASCPAGCCCCVLAGPLAEVSKAPNPSPAPASSSSKFATGLAR